MISSEAANGLTLTGADRTRREYRTRDNRGAVGVRCTAELGRRQAERAVTTARQLFLVETLLAPELGLYTWL